MSSQVQDNLYRIQKIVQNDLSTAVTIDGLANIKRKYFGKKGEVTQIIKQLSKLPSNQRSQLGKLANQIKNDFESLFEKKSEILKGEKAIDKPFFDTSLPGVKDELGTLHPITQVRLKAEEIFQKMGFTIVEPRLIDDDYHCFTSLNIPKEHPARDMWDTFGTEEDLIPITHTSSMQNRILKENSPPIAAIVPGRCFRHEATDASHEHTFYQIEGVYVDQGVTLADLIGTLQIFLENFFTRKLKIKIQPSYFPFVEPGIEILINCVICGGEGCSVCKKSGWLELVPAGPIHPSVFEMAGVDNEKFSGFAWGLGLDRLAMLKYKIDDIRWFHSGDLRFLKQF